MRVWRKWIRYKGIKWVAEQLGVHRESVRGWLNDGKTPKDINKIKLVRLAKGEFTIADFYEGEHNV